ncbi:hypothetical protein K505DRAFT_365080 [Melanomma pulvis-pyrius CBS 109.77]|uniref:Uncharacterized protein n=1 Tax=Melanomma pulvis-pyrius CBS 109.77 TaxID=1314802 RepID=A0A6A6X295_9PLEO|nr:hypothetical protein K505DRAFT_365080 [Melanomma pulvis-pyrius CBS 109.77]
MDPARLSDWRWALYTISLALSVLIPVVGGIVEKGGSSTALLMILTVLDIAWAILFGLFSLTFFERSSAFIIRCLYYLVCALLPLAFFGSFSGDLGLWLPTSLDLGIFVGKGIIDGWSLLTLQRIRHKLLRALGAETPLLPIHRHRRTSYTHPRTEADAAVFRLLDARHSNANTSPRASISDVSNEGTSRDLSQGLNAPEENPWDT